MARHELGPAGLRVAQEVRAGLLDAVAAGLPRGQSVGARPVAAVVVGVSGGADSLALAAGAAWCVRHVPELSALPVTGVVVDHGLQEGSAEIAARAAAQVEAMGVAARVVPVTVGPGRDGPEAAARAARYRALLGDRDAVVLVGHTLDDQAETVLLGLARGSGARSLAGMAPRQGRLVRPLLGLRRADTEEACREAGTVWWTDPHNADRRYARVRARTALADLENDLGPGLAEALARTADLSRVDADLLERLAAEVLVAAVTGEEIALQVAPLAEAHPALRDRALLMWLRRRGADDLSATHVRAVAALVTDWHGQSGVDVPGVRVTRRADLLHATPFA